MSREAIQELVNKKLAPLCDNSIFANRHKLNAWLKLNLKLKLREIKSPGIVQGVKIVTLCKKIMQNVTVSKYCKPCNTVKPHSQFYKNSRTRDGRVTKCKDCYKAYDAKRRKPPAVIRKPSKNSFRYILSTRWG